MRGWGWIWRRSTGKREQRFSAQSKAEFNPDGQNYGVENEGKQVRHRETGDEAAGKDWSATFSRGVDAVLTLHPVPVALA
ncbi:MAG: hypothetical protein GDA36_02395 [Rhodobacteraceae bacterium]|nr:hypothetical protein [Paracoccaceae bacterium]